MGEPANNQSPKPGPRPKSAVIKDKADPESYVRIAKNAVLENYNSSRDETYAPELKPEDLFIVDYHRILQNWEVYITSPLARRLVWQVTFNNYRNEVYLNVHQKIGSFRTTLKDKAPS